MLIPDAYRKIVQERGRGLTEVGVPGVALAR